MRRWLIESMMVPVIAILFIVSSFFFQSPKEFFEGYYLILTSRSILLTDYVELAGIGPALFNSGSLMLLAYMLVKKLNLKITGALFAGILTIGGFAFFGKNIVNVSLVFLGVVLYARYKKIQLRSIMVVFLFATGIGPISSLIMFGLDLPLWLGFVLGVTSGVLSGFLLVELSSRVISFHKGYDLYNVGFASGVLSLTYYSVISLFGFEYEADLLYSNDSHRTLLILFVTMCLLFVVIGLGLNNWSFKGLKEILSKTGRAVTDFTRRDNVPITLVNAGLTGLLSFALISVVGVQLNGPVIGGLMTIVGFGAFGKHLRNTFPPMLGVIIVVMLLNLDLSIGIILTILFSTALAPIAGERGILIGILAGMLHLPIGLILGEVHGGILLYSNGFSAAFTAVIIDNFVLSFERRKENGIA